VLVQDNSFCQKRSDLEKTRKEKLKEIENIENLITDTKKDKSFSLNKINLLSRKISIRNEIIENLNNEVDEIDIKINILSLDIATRNGEILNLKNEYQKIIYISYYRLKNFNQLMFILSSTSVNQAYRRLYYLRQYTVHRKNLLLRINNEILYIENNISDLKSEKDKKISLLNEKEKETKKLQEDKSNHKNLISEYNKKEVILKHDLKELQEATKRIELEIEKIIKEEAQAKLKRTKKASNDDLKLSKNFSSNKSKLPWPVENGTVISFFGEHPHPVFRGIMIKNDGIDISTNCNSSVRCIFDGVISKIFAIKGANFAVIIRHGNYLSVYQNLQVVNVKIGEQVKTKQNIGTSYCDNSNNISTVHFGLWLELTKLNPIDWLSSKN
jgi:septal ring factor EnvC (AmiA/AmiB activator)